ncbi:hypothetical protein [Streptomyces antimicrobicus]|uniref:Serine/arginine repetitive matrix protein 2 n=1 Tax=Streptomyces antimicrobicus TaxID=2883108 RepID=A0ABS8B5R6_9ACTN|nr:hypothetical protein [Streptomyces antimicrobicus]MCB5179955.1 hypothetical protein [Streptomyces antimicrobicus]
MRPAVAAVLVAIVVVGAATGWWLANRDEPARESRGTVSPGPPEPSAPTGAPGSGGPAASASSRSPGPATSGPSTSGSPGPGASASAEAREVLTDPKGFVVAVPSGWEREESGGSVFYRSPDRTALIQVFRVVEPDLSPVQAVERASADLGSRTPRYKEIRVGEVAGGAGELVYEYDSDESRGRRRGVERVLVAQDGNKWAVLAAGPAADWPRTQSRHEAALRAFRPGS